MKGQNNSSDWLKLLNDLFGKFSCAADKAGVYCSYILEIYWHQLKERERERERSSCNEHGHKGNLQLGDESECFLSKKLSY